MSAAPNALLSVRSLAVAFPGSSGEDVRVVDGVSLSISRGERVAVVGESGCGKSVTSLALLDLVPPPLRIVAGEVTFEGRDLRTLPESEKRKVRGGGIGLVFQEPGAALDPVRTIGSELVDVIRRHRGLSREDARTEALRWLSKVSLPDPERRFADLPHRMSGGMRQRAMLALALAGGPRLLVADEPTTALDVTIQAQILALLIALNRELSLALLVITHDLGVVAETAQRVVVMYAGEVVEEATAEELFARPVHPYTQGLLAARPDPRAPARTRLPTLEGGVPEPSVKRVGCSFAPRCPFVMDRCRSERPALVRGPGTTSRGACFLLYENSKLEPVTRVPDLPSADHGLRT